MQLSNLLKARATPKNLVCDVLVIGGGSGGLACAQAAAKRGASVVLCDYVRPSETKQTVWGLGGTCVNVGCVPKKLFHRAGLFGQAVADGELEAYGYGSLLEGGRTRQADWQTVISTVQNHVKMLNFTYGSALPANCEYVNGQARFEQIGEGKYVVTVREGSRGKTLGTTIQAQKAIIIAVGGRPAFPANVPQATKLGISSDDIFSLRKDPRKTLVVGSSYIGLETASFLNALGRDTSILVRSKPLRGRGFDDDCAGRVLDLMRNSGVKVRSGVDLRGLEEELDKRIKVQFSDSSTEIFDTVMFGTGRRPETAQLNLPASLPLSAEGKIKVDAKTFMASPAKIDAGLPDLYAIGDCAETGSPELTPVAIRQGELVASYITDGSSGSGETNSIQKRLGSLHYVPSTVFTLPSEYSRIGLSEKEAIAEYGASDVETYLREWQPLETSAAHVRAAEEGLDAGLRAFAKLICVKSLRDRVVGLHLISPTSSEAIHGLALACSLGATKSDFDAKVLGIHPTDAEGLTDMTVSRSSGQSFTVASGCGGGKCG